MKFDWRQEWLPLAAIAASLIVSLALYNRFPDQMPIHWGPAGQPDNFGSRAVGALLMPAIASGTYLLMLVLPRIDPRQENIRRFDDTYRLIRSGVVLFLVFTHFLALSATLGEGMTLNSSLMIAGLGLFLVVIGNYLPRTRSNWFLGVRTPWTLSSDRVWRKTHRLAGRLFVLTGILIAAVGFLLPGYVVPVLLVGVIVMAGIPLIHSYCIYRRDERQS